MDVGVVLNGRSSAQEIAELAHLAEQNGISQVWLSGGSRTKDHFLRLALAATRTKKVLLGPVAISPFEMHPVRIGLSLLTLDEIGENRASIVLGGGGDLAATLGIPLKGRAESVGETVDIIHSLARGGEVNYNGKLFKVKELFSPWTRRHVPPLYVGANRPRMLRMAVEKADGVMFTDMPPNYAGTLVDRVNAELGKDRRDPTGFRINNWFVWNVQETEEEAMRIAQRYLGFRLYYVRDVAPSIGLDGTAAEELEKMQPRMIRAIFQGRHAELPSKSLTKLLIDHLTITGSKKSLGRCVETLHDFERKGLNEIALAVQGNPAESIRLLGEHVIPVLQAI